MIPLKKMYPLFIYCGRLSDHPSDGTLTDVFDNFVHLTALTTQWKAVLTAERIYCRIVFFFFDTHFKAYPFPLVMQVDLRRGRTTLRRGKVIAQVRIVGRQVRTQYCKFVTNPFQ